MTKELLEIDRLPTDAADIDTVESIKRLQGISTLPTNKDDAIRVLEHLAAVIRKESDLGNTTDAPPVNQVVLNLSFRSYFQVLRKYDLEDKHFAHLIGHEALCHRSEGLFQMIYALLLADCKADCVRRLCKRCLRALGLAIKENTSSLLAILKTLNLLCRKVPSLDVELSLDQAYHCLQNNAGTGGTGQCGLRDETLSLFTHSCKQPERAFANFHLIMEFWPWTNRHKLYLLSCIFNTYSARDFLTAAQYNMDEFFSGVRLSLSFQSLLASSQYLVKSLSSQQSPELLALAVRILTRGTLKEIQNFHSQWFARIAQRDALFELLQQQPEVTKFLDDTDCSTDSTERYRLILIFSMFSRQIFYVSKVHFFKISTELITNCFKYEIEAQLLIFKFIVENLSNFSIEDCLEFIGAFICRHKGVESAQLRNNILGKMPTVINYVSKSFSKQASDKTTLASSIRLFFHQLQQHIEIDIRSEKYQPKIFSLKLFDILLKSLYSRRPVKNAKNCILLQNKRLGEFLVDQQVFNGAQMCAKLLELLNDPLGFDDALELTVVLLGELNEFNTATKSAMLCAEFCYRSEIDECALSALYARVALQHLDAETPKATSRQSDANQLFEFAMCALGTQKLGAFRQDPLAAGKRGRHLFGHLYTLNEILISQALSQLPLSFLELLTLLNSIVQMILQLLNVNNDSAAAPSFQDMDESLQLLVEKSVHPSSLHPEESRKFLLMSFWLTLKACCEVATTVGRILAPTSEDCTNDLDALKQCLQIHVAVLTRCRHKGAIESAGISIGKLTKNITKLDVGTRAYAALHECLQLLCTDDGKLVSTTRRGAGFSVMFLHMVKNEEQRSRPLLKRAVNSILGRLQTTTKATASAADTFNCDRIEALTLHYLCVLVRDTELREPMAKYYNEIMLAAIQQIDNGDWTLCNAALQLFGALVPKIVGQRQANEFDAIATVAWESSELTYDEIARRLPSCVAEMLAYCATKYNASMSTRSIILFLGFLSKVEHVRKGTAPCDPDALLERIRALMWRLLRHNCEKVRKLAALCLVRAHEFRCELPHALLQVAQTLFSVFDENFFEGLVYALYDGVLKIRHESKHVLSAAQVLDFEQRLCQTLAAHYQRRNFKLYTLSKLLDLLLLLEFDHHSRIVKDLVELAPSVRTAIGSDVWISRLAQIHH